MLLSIKIRVKIWPMIKLIAGLGNPGFRFKKTRHNFGFLVLDSLARNNQAVFMMKKDFNSLLAKINLNGQIILATKSQTMMINSGQAIKKISQYYKIKPQEIMVIHDDFDIGFNQMKFGFGRSSASHKGAESIIQHLGTKNFFRLRLGIKPEKELKMPLEKFVLEKFNKQERLALPLVIKKAAEIISAAVSYAIETPDQLVNQLHNQFNLSISAL